MTKVLRLKICYEKDLIWMKCESCIFFLKASKTKCYTEVFCLVFKFSKSIHLFSKKYSMSEQ